MVADAGSVHTRRWTTGLQARGHEICLVTERPWPDAPVPITLLPKLGRGRWNLGVLAGQVRARAAGWRADVVHAHYASHYGFLAALARVRPLVISVWGADVEVFPTRWAPNRWILAWTLARADRITATSRYLAAVTARYSAGRRIDVVPWGVDQSWLESPGKGPPEGPLTVIANKHLEPVYGLDLLLEAMAGLAPPWRLVLLGRGSAEDALRERARRLGIADRVEWPGAVDPATVRRYLDAAHMAAFPSRRESFSVATLEAAARGLPVVASRVGGLPEVVEDGVTGLLIEPENTEGLRQALADLAADPARRRQMGAAGRRMVAERFRWTATLEAMESVYAREGA